LPFVLRTAAEIRAVKVEALADATWENAVALWP
jgi:Tat protein secretion system quality control protein TatD with DNase activity